MLLLAVAAGAGDGGKGSPSSLGEKKAEAAANC